jgi:hypothetical protein
MTTYHAEVMWVIDLNERWGLKVVGVDDAAVILLVLTTQQRIYLLDKDAELFWAG